MSLFRLDHPTTGDMWNSHHPTGDISSKKYICKWCSKFQKQDIYQPVFIIHNVFIQLSLVQEIDSGIQPLVGELFLHMSTIHDSWYYIYINTIRIICNIYILDVTIISMRFIHIHHIYIYNIVKLHTYIPYHTRPYHCIALHCVALRCITLHYITYIHTCMCVYLTELIYIVYIYIDYWNCKCSTLSLPGAAAAVRLPCGGQVGQRCLGAVPTESWLRP